MSGNAPMSMTPWLHFGSTDNLFFETWRPSSRGAIVGACIGLFLFCISQRCLDAYRRTQELRWTARTVLVSKSGIEDSARLAPPLAVSRDIPRGVIHAIQSTFSYILMLAVMTFNGAYIISIILGLGVGEALFGRLGRR